MAKKNKKFYLSTALPYVNEFPHAGWALEIIQADVIARYHRLLAEDVFFLTGTDENSLKNVRAAEEEGMSVKKLVDRNAKKFHELKDILNLSFNDFIRTTEERHIKGAQKLWKACQKDIYKKSYRGLYCVGCEEFYKENELENGLCPEHKTRPDLVEEENYFFRLSKYQDKLKTIIESDEAKIIPQVRKNEIISFINSGLEDICISRLSERGRGWGIPVPGDPSQILWTWFDALSNYVNALGYGENSKKFQEWWQKNENKLHIVGKGILRFHGIYWIAFLLSAKLALPKIIFVHGYLTSAGQKMSKSLGNVIDPFELVKKYGCDPVRYFLLREIPPTEDGDFTYQKFEERYNADLASGLGNLVARVVTLAAELKTQKSNLKNRASKGSEGEDENEVFIAPETQNLKLKEEIKKTQQKYKKALAEFKFNEALISTWDLISFCDKYIERERPWEKSEKQLSIINNLLFALDNIAQLLQPFLPETSEKIKKQLKTKKSQPLFPRI
ncbi:MAG: methionine--tRNA ligase [Candidatus Nealsonbacteria bacterium CG_4_8_14_3_um_filter_37_36]|uniref:Methionine--tRNA ligase n=3 Tax=Candidatus Nealsoniibacteriota TaxID=1817911 RepID=A0A2M7EBK6_9BACT|nr:MAG: methionine--tRNA ligase [Candidatus Nealsonbacteria bacterium CG01_land_8_20_14_3_00_12]PIW91547.1 MAG: methionine--tRNA ligase [Candidatus Nealsonbacteria bacterium CG_4_8_14_3_um_filter_37_36]PJA83396.1 MAG: methionine--tRNA ligase [Candidatus Nealsonbacteria bacterium CG_4_9_14_3_um_filter_37_29]